MDCACLIEKGFFKQSELSVEEQKHAVRVIVVYCGGSRSPFMHVAPSKATSMDKIAAERVVEDIAYLGHTRVIVRSANELRAQCRMTPRQLGRQRCQCATSSAR